MFGQNKTETRQRPLPSLWPFRVTLDSSSCPVTSTGPSTKFTRVQPHGFSVPPMHLGLHSHLLFRLPQIRTFSVSSTSVVPVLRTISSHNSHSEKTCGHVNGEQGEKLFKWLLHHFLFFFTPGSEGTFLGSTRLAFCLLHRRRLTTVLYSAFWKVHKSGF